MRQPRGQNFLTDNNIARKIVAAAGIAPSDKVFEIGPGRGALTEPLALAAKELKAVEIDRVLFEGLKNRFAAYKNTELVLSDFLGYPFRDEAGPLKIVSNLPYDASTAIIEKFLPAGNWSRAVIMVQKEVGQRLTAAPGTGEYGSFTVLCRHYASAKKLFSVGPGCFFPKPKVDSAVLELTNLFPEELAPAFCGFVRAAFSQRRKTALNSISSSLELPKESVLGAFGSSGIDPSLRPENLTLDQFRLLYKNLHFTADN